MSVHYDDLDINRDIRLDLPLREGIGIVTQDVAKPHHLVTMVGTPAWTILDSYLNVITLDGATQYASCAGATCADLDFTTGDYSLADWIFIQSGDPSEELLNRFSLNANGWELYHYSNLIMTLRHHHSLYTPPGGSNPRTASYSENWALNTWYFLGVSRPGGENAIFYRNGLAIPTFSSAGGLHDPESCVQNLNIGANPGPVNRHLGMFWRPRVWARVLTAADWAWIYEREVRWFRS